MLEVFVTGFFLFVFFVGALIGALVDLGDLFLPALPVLTPPPTRPFPTGA